MTSLPASDCSMSLLLQWETRGRRWFEGVSVVQPVSRSMMTVDRNKRSLKIRPLILL